MSASGESSKEAIRPNFNRSIMMDFQGAKLSSDTGFFLMRELDQRHGVIAPMADALDDVRSASHTKHTLVQMIRQRVYQMAAGYEDCNDADFLRVDPALRLSLDKGKKLGAGRLRVVLVIVGRICWGVTFGREGHMKKVALVVVCILGLALSVGMAAAAESESADELGLLLEKAESEMENSGKISAETRIRMREILKRLGQSDECAKLAFELIHCIECLHAGSCQLDECKREFIEYLYKCR